MSTDIVFNDISLPFQDFTTCQKNLPIFFSLLSRLMQEGVDVVRIAESIGDNWFNIIYAENFNFSQWFSSTNRDFQRRVKSIATRSSFFKEDEVEFYNEYKNCDFFLKEIKDKKAIALGAASLLNLFVISFNSSTIWLKVSIEIVKHQMVAQADSIMVNTICVSNISVNQHLQPYIDQIKAERQASKNYFNNFTYENNNYFLNLVFCENSLKNLKQTDIDLYLRKKICNILELLNSAIQTSSNIQGIIEHSKLDISPESGPTKANSRLMRLRTFKLPNGSNMEFNWHVKNFSHYQRLYFEPDFQNRKIYIGYFGKHLETSSS